MDEYTTLRYYEDKTSEELTFNKYEINACGIIRNKKTEKKLSYKLMSGYHTVYHMTMLEK